jgi:hypothetical protein
LLPPEVDPAALTGSKVFTKKLDSSRDKRVV